jgi:hypothetical protein
VLTGGIFGGIGTFFEKFGGIPFENLALLLAAGVVALVAVFLRRRDQEGGRANGSAGGGVTCSLHST